MLIVQQQPLNSGDAFRRCRIWFKYADHINIFFVCKIQFASLEIDIHLYVCTMYINTHLSIYGCMAVCLNRYAAIVCMNSFFRGFLPSQCPKECTTRQPDFKCAPSTSTFIITFVRGYKLNESRRASLRI